MGRKKKHEEHVNHERWLVSYADFITLLFAFFVVMYAISQADLAKLQKVARSIRAAFGGSGSQAVVDMDGSGGGNTVNQFEMIPKGTGRVLSLPAGKTNSATAQDEQLQTMKDMLEETITMELGVSMLTDRMQMVFDSNGLVLRLAVKDLFDHQSKEIHGDLIPLLDRVGRILSTTNRIIRIEGHADVSEKGSKKFRNTWELSTARAEWLASYWLDRFGFDPKQIGIAGYGHYRPIEDAKSAWARGANRRVEVIVSNNEFVKGER